jgi:hypothetical protein
MTSLRNQILVRAVDDDRPIAVVGEVTGWTDENTVLVLWPGATEAIEESMDELSPVRPRGEC